MSAEKGVMRGRSDDVRARDSATRDMSEERPVVQRAMIGMIRIATMLATLIIGLIAGPAVSL